MKLFKIISMLLFVSFTCNAQDIQILKKDSNLIAYKIVSNKIKDKMKSNYYNLPKNYISLQPLLIKTSDPKDMEKILKENGMLHSDEFVKDIKSQNVFMRKFIITHPELSKLDTKKRSEIISQLLIN